MGVSVSAGSAEMVAVTLAVAVGVGGSAVSSVSSEDGRRTTNAITRTTIAAARKPSRAPPLTALVARGAARERDPLGHLAVGLVDHLALEDGRAGPGTVRLVVGGEHRLGALPLFARGREDLVDDRDLARVDGPLAVDAQRAGEPGPGAQAVVVLDVPVRAVDGLDAGRAGRDHQS